MRITLLNVLYKCIKEREERTMLKLECTFEFFFKLQSQEVRS